MEKECEDDAAKAQSEEDKVEDEAFRAARQHNRDKVQNPFFRSRSPVNMFPGHLRVLKDGWYYILHKGRHVYIVSLCIYIGRIISVAYHTQYLHVFELHIFDLFAHFEVVIPRVLFCDLPLDRHLYFSYLAGPVVLFAYIRPNWSQ